MKSDLLRVQDVRDAYRLIGACRDLGIEPSLWQPRLLEGLCRLIGGPSAQGGEGRRVALPRAIEVLTNTQAGMDARGLAILQDYMREFGPGHDPVFRVLLELPGRVLTRTRPELVSDEVWCRSVMFNEIFRPVGVEHRLVSVYRTSDDGAFHVLHVSRSPGERNFSARAQRLLNFLHAELGPLIGRSLVSAAEPTPDKLAPRLRQTLAYLLEGDGEKQVAARIGLSQATIHQYVTALYRHFRVSSRSQLLAFAFKRTGHEPWRRLDRPEMAQEPEPDYGPRARDSSSVGRRNSPGSAEPGDENS